MRLIAFVVVVVSFASALVAPTPPHVLIVDGDNVRGKANWAWSAAELTATVSQQAATQTILFLDHAEAREALSTGPLSVLAFAGRAATADDAIVDSVNWLFRETDASVQVVTSDFGLRSRVHYVKTTLRLERRRLAFLHAQKFLDETLKSSSRDELSFVRRFASAHRDLADHVRRTTPRRVFTRRGPKEPLIRNEQTWMRVLLAERLRLDLRRESARPRDDLLAAFADAYDDGFPPDDDDSASSRLLLHPFEDRRQRESLFRFASALRQRQASHTNSTGSSAGAAFEDASPPPPLDDENDDLESNESPLRREEEEEDVAPPRYLFVKRPSRRERRKRSRRFRELGIVAGPAQTPPRSAKALKVLMQDRDVLEDAVAAWLRDPQHNDPPIRV